MNPELQKQPDDAKMDQEDNSSTIEVNYDHVNVPGRGTWGGKIEFILTCVSFAVGLGNVWRFPYLCFKNGGGAFLIPYVIMLAAMGLPLFFMEFAFGQFASVGPVSVWSISPLFKGVGYAMTTVIWLVQVYYNVIVAQAFLYLFVSFNSRPPWSSCGNWWNNPVTCLDQTNSTNTTVPLKETTSASSEYYYNYILRLSSGIDEIGTPVWHLTLCLLLAWILCCLVLIKGVKSLGKTSYFTAIFPYIMLTILLIRVALLPGSLEGVKYYLTPDFSKLKDATAWTDAATQLFFSLSCCNGGLIALSSYNKFNNNCCRDAILVACINCLTSIYAGFVVFSTLGFMAVTRGVGIADVAASGPGLVFVVYPEAINQMPLPVLWAVFFFLMLVTLGLGSEFPLVETLLSTAQDEFRQYGYLQTKASQMIFRVCLCSFNFLIALPMVCNGGFYLLNLIDSALSGYPLLFICLAEVTVICYVYGLNQFRRDIELMTTVRPNWYWRITWLVITPLTAIGLIIFKIVTERPLTLDKYEYPAWAQVFGRLIGVFPIVCIPAWFIFKYCREGGWIVLREFFKPTHTWGPAEDEHRNEFLSQVREREQQKKQQQEDVETGENKLFTSQLSLGGSKLNSATCLRTTASCLALSAAQADEPSFFQSKLSIAEKLTYAHAKDLVKRGGPDFLNSSEAIAAAAAEGADTTDAANEADDEVKDSSTVGQSGPVPQFTLEEPSPKPRRSKRKAPSFSDLRDTLPKREG
uniref:Transporter n=1 Tax=Schistocephalus solidus TaxID=70667 RepID=A0A0X3PNC8_SCHSO